MGVVFCVYMLEFPNNKKYIGCSRNKLSWRAGINGKKYTAKKIKQAISEFGWENVKKIILKDNLSYDNAKYYEDYFILKYNTIDESFGYNTQRGGKFIEKPKGHPFVMSIGRRKWLDSKINVPLSDEHKENIKNAHIKRLDYYIAQYDLNENLIQKWESACEIQRQLGIRKQKICNCCLLNEVRPHTIHSSAGYIWKKEKKEGNK